MGITISVLERTKEGMYKVQYSFDDETWGKRYSFCRVKGRHAV